MELVKLATEWAKAEVFSTRFFIVFALLFLIASIGFWQLGKTDLAKAYIIPTLVAGLLLMIIGVGLVYTNTNRVTEFETAYHQDGTAFIASEFDRIEATLKEYNTVVFKAIPILMILASFLLVFVDKPLWRTISTTTIAMLIVILLIDGTAHARIQVYKTQLKELSQKEKLLQRALHAKAIRIQPKTNNQAFGYRSDVRGMSKILSGKGVGNMNFNYGSIDAFYSVANGH